MSSGTVLVVDDEKNIVQLAKLYLTSEGYSVESAFNGVEALDKVKSHHPNLVVLDLMMPQMDGWEVCRRLRKESDIPIIILTARDDDVDKISVWSWARTTTSPSPSIRGSWSHGSRPSYGAISPRSGRPDSSRQATSRSISTAAR